MRIIRYGILCADETTNGELMMSETSKKVAVIGAGASGMMAAIHALRCGCSVTVFEKQKKAGRKLAVTGNGQCNISNRNLDVSRYHGQNPMFVRNLFARFGLDETIEFFDSIGIPFVEKKQGKLYPCSLQAQSVADILEYEVGRGGGEISLHRRVDGIRKTGSGIELVTAGDERHVFDSVILAAGGCAYPQIGASTQGFELASSVGHSVVDPYPAILPITIPLRALHRLEGIKWDVSLSAVLDGKIVRRAEGEILFTRYGISGPVSLEISRAVNEPLLKGKYPVIEINLFPDKKESEVSEMFDLLFSDPQKEVAFAMEGVLKKRIPDIFIGIAGIDPHKRCGELSRQDIASVVQCCTSLQLEPGEVRPFSEAVTSAGGVPVNEVVPSTMESKKMSGVYLCGEVLDIDGDSGGFNLQFAWSSGAVAGMSQSR